MKQTEKKPKFGLSIKNAWSTPMSKILTVTGPLAGVALYYFGGSLDVTTVGGAVIVTLLGLLAGKPRT